MPTQRVLDIFDEHHARAIAIMAAQRALLAPGSVPDPAAQARHRWELLRVLVEFQIFKHRDIFDPLIRQGDPRVAPRAQAMKAECAELGTEVRAFVTRWSDGSVDRDWDRFRTATLTLIAKVERGLAAQRQIVAAMAGAPPRPQATNGIVR
jgi:hypothetical protein